MSTRIDRDSLGEVEVPAEVLWGAHTARAVANFDITGIPVGRHRFLVSALGSVKQAAARTNHDLGLLTDEAYDAIERACLEVRIGDLDDEFVVDVLQGGAGTSTNMNANEVIAHRALALLGRGPGDPMIDALDHVNRSQSTNDVYPTAVKIALLDSLGPLTEAVRQLSESFADRGRAFAGVPKLGRTQLQEAVPMTVGQEFLGWSVTVAEELARLEAARPLLCEINLGATAIGTGIAAPRDYARQVCAHLRDLTGLPLVTAGNLIEATSDTGVFLHLSGVLKRTAVKVSKICNDLRLLASGPQAGFGELRLPPRQAGSSIMPGKINPVIPEMVNQVAFSVVGVDAVVTMAAEGGQLQLNAFEPVMAHHLLQAIEWMTAAFDRLDRLCVRDIEVDTDRLTALSAASVGLATALTPALGYAASAAIAKKALAGHGTVRELAVATGMLTDEEAAMLLAPERLAGIITSPG